MLLPCYRCSTSNPLYNPRGGNCCVNCGEPYIFSWVQFDVLPLVEFQLDTGITHQEAIALLLSSPDDDRLKTHSDAGTASWQKESTNQYETLTLTGQSDTTDSLLYDLRASQSRARPKGMEQTASQTHPEEVGRNLVQVGRDSLRKWTRSQVLFTEVPSLLDDAGGVVRRYFRNLMPDIHVTLCPACHKFFHSDEFELAVLQQGACPFCRSSIKLDQVM